MTSAGEITTKENVLKPLLKWAGGKRWLAPRIASMLRQKPYKRYVEAFAGGMSTALELKPESAIINDRNVHLIHFYNMVKAGLSFSDLTPDLNTEEQYYAFRKDFNSCIMYTGDIFDAKKAVLFYYLNRTCFNGLCRFNSSGQFNTPYGKYKNVNYVKDLNPYQELFKNWDFSSTDFSGIALKDGDIIYADPPYDVQFVQYDGAGFKWEDQIRLAYWLKNSNLPFVLSGQATERIVQLYGDMGFDISYLDAPRRISANGDRTKAKEVLVTYKLK